MQVSTAVEAVVVTEQTGAVWQARATGLTGARAYEVRLLRGESAAKPSILLFYAETIKAACEKLAN